MRASEEPERREEVTDADITAYVAAEEAAAESAAANALDGFAGGGGGGGGANAEPGGKRQSMAVGLGKENDKGLECAGKGSDVTSKVTGETMEALVAKLAAQFPPTPTEKTQRALNEHRWVRRTCSCW